MMRRPRSGDPSASAERQWKLSPGRCVARYALMTLLTVLAVIAGWIAAAAAFLAVAAASSSIPLLLAAGGVACLLAAAGAGRLGARLARLARASRYAAVTGLAGTALLAAVCSATVLRPLPGPARDRVRPGAAAEPARDGQRPVRQHLHHQEHAAHAHGYPHPAGV